MTRTDEMKDLTLLGNQKTTYTYDYDPSILESFDNRHVDNDYFIKFNCPLHHFVRLLGNQILRRFIFLIFQINFAWNQNH